jgi:predicted nucleic acid-binding protein
MNVFIILAKSEISKGLCGAPARSRTADLLITNQLLKSNLTFVSNNNLEIF